MEISSFQLEQMTLSPQVAAILNITPNHLDRHGSMQAYKAPKLAYWLSKVSKISQFLTVKTRAHGPCQSSTRPAGEFRPLAFSAGQSGTYVKDGEICLQSGGKTEAVMPLSDVRLRVNIT